MADHVGARDVVAADDVREQRQQRVDLRFGEFAVAIAWPGLSSSMPMLAEFTSWCPRQ